MSAKNNNLTVIECPSRLLKTVNLYSSLWRSVIRVNIHIYNNAYIHKRI